MNTSRRNFVKKSGLAASSLAFLSPWMLAEGYNRQKAIESLGFQVWTVRNELAKDLEGTCRMMAGLGYRELEMCSPLGYSMIGFKSLNEISGTELRKRIEGEGLVCRSSHFTFGELKDNIDDRIEWSNQMGIEQMILSTFWLPGEATMDDYRKAADELNKIGEKTKAAGIQTGFHNHHFEFKRIGDELIYDALLDQFDPDLVKMQFQVAVINEGFKAADYFKKYPGRFISAHLADWSNELDAAVPVGQGIVEWKEFFEAAKIGGVKNFFVEMEPDAFEKSADFLSQM